MSRERDALDYLEDAATILSLVEEHPEMIALGQQVPGDQIPRALKIVGQMIDDAHHEIAFSMGIEALEEIKAERSSQEVTE